MSDDERRTRRSEERAVALRYQLEHTRHRGGLEALVLADGYGLVVAHAGDEAVCSELGALAPVFSGHSFSIPVPPLLEGADIEVLPLSLLGQKLFLACTGGGMARDALLTHSASGVSRILETN
ncbi:MAG: hypothetical protein AAF355_14990 [Myxococcota bacterium]